MANSGKDAALPGVYAYLYGREKFKLKVLDFRAWMSQFSVLHSRFNVFITNWFWYVNSNKFYVLKFVLYIVHDYIIFYFNIYQKTKLRYLFCFILNCKWNCYLPFCFCFQADKYRPHVTPTVLVRGSFINAIVASVSNFTNNKRGLKPCYRAYRFSICFVTEEYEKWWLHLNCMHYVFVCHVILGISL